jgi:tRNA threonylcarbamoyladenosine modification (KEOPS) complex  Pcc1 subunit
MFEFKMKIPCSKPDLVAKSLEPDIKNDKYSKISMKAGKGFLILNVKSEKVGHMKAIVNTYISLVQTLDSLERDEGEK